MPPGPQDLLPFRTLLLHEAWRWSAETTPLARAWIRARLPTDARWWTEKVASNLPRTVQDILPCMLLHPSLGHPQALVAAHDMTQMAMDMVAPYQAMLPDTNFPLGREWLHLDIAFPMQAALYASGAFVAHELLWDDLRGGLDRWPPSIRIRKLPKSLPSSLRREVSKSLGLLARSLPTTRTIWPQEFDECRQTIDRVLKPRRARLPVMLARSFAHGWIGGLESAFDRESGHDIYARFWPRGHVSPA